MWNLIQAFLFIRKIWNSKFGSDLCIILSIVIFRTVHRFQLAQFAPPVIRCNGKLYER